MVSAALVAAASSRGPRPAIAADAIQNGQGIDSRSLAIAVDVGKILTIGIAATANEHVTVLTNLAEVIEEPEDADKLIHATDPMEIVERLSRPQEETELA